MCISYFFRYVYMYCFVSYFVCIWCSSAFVNVKYYIRYPVKFPYYYYAFKCFNFFMLAVCYFFVLV